MAERDLILLDICNNPFTAEQLKGRLDEAGIPCMVVDQTLTGVYGGYGALPGYAVKVFAKYEESARKIVDDWKKEQQDDVMNMED